MRFSYAAIALLTGVAGAQASIVTLDFETEDDFLTPLVNGQEISDPNLPNGEFGNLVTISSSTDPVAIFDSTDPGPNSTGPDPDLLVNTGNLLILQSSNSLSKTGDVFDTPNDEAGGGSLLFDFSVHPDGFVELLDVLVADINGGGNFTLTLTDVNGNTRFFTVTDNFSFDIANSGPNGYEILDLTTTAVQVGEGGGNASAVDDPGYDPLRVVTMEFDFAGSAGVDDLRFIPSPGAVTLLGLGGLAAIRRRR
ncbi:MAG: hypothetical protein AAFX05_12420 [Planctomycetota bacterium]